MKFRARRWEVRLLAPLLLALSTGARAQDAPPPFEPEVFHAPLRRAEAARASLASPHFDAVYYHLTLDLRFGPDHLAGRVRVEGRAAGAPLDGLDLDFTDRLRVDSVRAADGRRLSFTHEGYRLSITLPAAVPAGGRVAVEVFYQGLPSGAGIGGDPAFAFSRPGDRDGSPVAWTLSEPYGARDWWPCKDHPSDKADSVRLTVTVPAPLRVGSNGLLEWERSEGGRNSYQWFERYPIATYLVSLAAAEYVTDAQTYERPDSLAARLGPLRLPVLHYVYPTHLSWLDGWRQVTDVLPVFEHWFGAYPFPEEKYGHAQFGWPGGMEHQTMSSMGGAGIGLVAHELAHMWFGDLVTLRFWPHLWLNEGFATYATTLYFEHLDRTGASPGLWMQAKQVMMASARQAVGPLVTQDTLDVGSLFSSARTYNKGAAVLHMLRGVVGSDVFREILHAYTLDPAFRYGTATTGDFRAVAERVSGRELGFFFEQWAYRAGYPAYEIEWDAVPAAQGGHDVRVRVRQTQAGEAFRMPVTLAVATEAGEERFTVTNDGRDQAYVLHAAARPIELRFDPELDLLRNEEVPVQAGSGEEQPRELAVTGLYPNPAAGRFALALDLAAALPVRAALYDATGRRVAEMLDETLAAGPHALSFETGSLPPGVYFLRVTTPRDAFVRRVVILQEPGNGTR